MTDQASRSQYRPTSVSPPGETLRELLEERGISQAELAERAGRPRKTISEILSGKAAITAETAIQLELVLGVPAAFWGAREARYRESLARQEEQERLATAASWAEQFPLAEMRARGWIPEVKSRPAVAQALLEFFGVASPAQWDVLQERAAVAYRRSPSFSADELALAVWLRRGEQLAEYAHTEDFTEASFRDCLADCRRLTRERPETFRPALQARCAEAGVVVAFVPELEGCRAYGATRWISPRRALIQLSFRYQTDDHFWFTFFHEAAHILFHRKRLIFVESEESEGSEEREADRFAGEWLVPSEAIRDLNPASVSKPFLLALAEQLGVSPGILVGRLQHEQIVPYSRYNKLKTRLTWGWQEEEIPGRPS